MKLTEFKRLMRRNWWLLVLIPVVTAISIVIFSSFKEKLYVSKTTIFTGIASGYRIAGDNNAGYKLGADNAFGNFNGILSARDTKEEVLLRLLAIHLMQTEPNPKVLSQENFERMQVLFPAPVREKIVAPTYEETLTNLTAYYKSDRSNEVLSVMVDAEEPIYSYQALTTVSAKRVGLSEMVDLEYSSPDPAVSQQTLAILTDVFARKHKELHSGQTETVIGFFDTATKAAHERLRNAEQQLLEFHQVNKIISYEDEISSTSSEKNTAADRYATLEMSYASALASLKAIEEKLKPRRKVVTTQEQEIRRLRDRLATINTQMTELETSTKDRSDAAYAANLARLKQEEASVTEQLRGTIDNVYDVTHSIEGASTNGLLDEWVRNTIMVEQIKSQLNQVKMQQASSAGEYDRLVPLGAEVRKLRREVEIAEREYLTQMDGLKQSMLTQQNIDLASQLKVLDPPNYPSRSIEDTVLPLLVLFGVIGALIVTIMGIVTADMLNSSLRTPAYAAKITGYPVMGVLPDVTTLKNNQLGEASRAEEQLTRQLILKYHQRADTQKPYVVGLLSGHSGEGKSLVGTTLATKLNSMGIETLLMLPEDHADQFTSFDKTAFYSPLQGISENTSIERLAGNGVQNFPIVLVEFPAVLENNYPVSLLHQLDLALITVKSSRVWQDADKKVFSSIQKMVNAPIEVILNGVIPMYVEEFSGSKLLGMKGGDQKALMSPKSTDENKWEKEAVLIS